MACHSGKYGFLPQGISAIPAHSATRNFRKTSDYFEGFRGLKLEIQQSYLIYNISSIINRDYFMVGECVRFLFTSSERSLNERVSAANE